VGIRRIRKRICLKVQHWFLIKKIMHTYRRVRLTPSKEVIVVEENEPINPPDLEMWAVYNPKGERVGLYLSDEEAAAECLDRTKKAKKFQNGVKATKAKKKK